MTIRRTVYICDHYRCHLRTHRFYRYSMHRTLTGHRPQRRWIERSVQLDLRLVLCAGFLVGAMLWYL